MAETAAQKKRSAAAKKAAETRKKNAEAQEEAKNGDDIEATEDTSSEDTSSEDRDPGPYVPRHRPLQAAGVDQAEVEKQRQDELAAERDAHLKRTGDVTLAQS